MKMFCAYSDHVNVFTCSRSGANDSRVIMKEVTKKDMKRHKPGRSVSLGFLAVLHKFTDAQIGN